MNESAVMGVCLVVAVLALVGLCGAMIWLLWKRMPVGDLAKAYDIAYMAMRFMEQGAGIRTRKQLIEDLEQRRRDVSARMQAEFQESLYTPAADEPPPLEPDEVEIGLHGNTPIRTGD